jgi:hypothetical protein
VTLHVHSGVEALRDWSELDHHAATVIEFKTDHLRDMASREQLTGGTGSQLPPAPTIKK